MEINSSETPSQRALAIWEEALGPKHPQVAASLSNLALLYTEQGQYGQAEPLFQRVLAIFEPALGFEYPYVASILESYAGLLYKTNRDTEAAQIEARAQDIRIRHTSVKPKKKWTGLRLGSQSAVWILALILPFLVFNCSTFA